jgi:hypothetical protein
MSRILRGDVLVIAGIAAFIEAQSHRPVCAVGGGSEHLESGLSQTAYDLMGIGGWARLIVGGLLVGAAASHTNR